MRKSYGIGFYEYFLLIKMQVFIVVFHVYAGMDVLPDMAQSPCKDDVFAAHIPDGVFKLLFVKIRLVVLGKAYAVRAHKVFD